MLKFANDAKRKICLTTSTVWRSKQSLAFLTLSVLETKESTIEIRVSIWLSVERIFWLQNWLNLKIQKIAEFGQILAVILHFGPIFEQFCADLSLIFSTSVFSHERFAFSIDPQRPKNLAPRVKMFISCLAQKLKNVLAALIKIF